ncbi:MAG: hypothetical protein H6R40_1178, partial [Gemmatimonadetes bacterium]|nr:hypothetical protein [Gemmatimonadota bacterium]
MTMTRRITAGLALLAMLAAACSTSDSLTPNEPNQVEKRLPGPQPAGTYDPTACAAKDTSAINAEFREIVTNTPISGWPSISSFEAKVKNAYNLRATDLDGARATIADLVDFLQKKYASSPQYGTLDAEVNALITDLWCFVGLGGTRFDIDPNDPKKDFALPGEGGVTFPDGFCPATANEYWPNGCPGINVFLSTLDPDSDPLKTPLDVYPTYLVIETYPALPPALMQAMPPTVAVCFNAPADIQQTIYLAHQKSGVNDESGFSIRPRVPIGDDLEALLGCPDLFAQAPSATKSFFAQITGKVADFFLPRSVEAATMFAFGGVGGSAEEFSPFGAVDAGLSFGGVGGSAEEFAPPVFLGPNAITYPTGSVIGTAGTGKVTNGLPSVVLKTRRDQTVIGNVNVTFAVQATDSVIDGKLVWSPT